MFTFHSKKKIYFWYILAHMLSVAHRSCASPPIKCAYYVFFYVSCFNPSLIVSCFLGSCALSKRTHIVPCCTDTCRATCCLAHWPHTHAYARAHTHTYNFSLIKTFSFWQVRMPLKGEKKTCYLLYFCIILYFNGILTLTNTYICLSKFHLMLYLF